ncbi:MAG: amidohydrolase family protein [Acidobacteriaceae bacterium]
MRLRHARFFGSAVLLLAPALWMLPAIQAQTIALKSPATLSPAVMRYVKVPAGRILLKDVRVIDGTGAAAMEHQMILIVGGKIESITPDVADPKVSADTAVIQLSGRTVFPGLVGMHDHLFYLARPNLNAAGASEPPLFVPYLPFSSTHLYLGTGVTTLRTTGSVEPYADINLRDEIDAGELPGPHLDVTGPYLEGGKSSFMQMHKLRDVEDARETVDFWAKQGVTSFKAYMYITRAELKAAIEEAHRHGMKITGHLCAVTYPEAAELGIDDLEHGFFVNTELDPGKDPDECPRTVGNATMEKMKAGSPEAKALIDLLVSHHVALTSTLPVFQSYDPAHLHIQPRVLEAMSPPTREAYLYTRNLELMRAASNPAMAEQRAAIFKNGMALEREFVAAGGMLLAGPDPTGDGGTLPGYGDQREVELLVEEGFTPVEAIKIATLNGATFEGLAARIGSIAPGKDADLVVVDGDPSQHIDDIEKTEIVFKDGVGYDSQKLLESVKGRYGQY